MIAYERISNIALERSAETARDIIETGWHPRGYPNLTLDGPIPWHLVDNQLRSWNFHIHSWDMLDSLLMAHSFTQETRYLEPTVKVALDWVAACGQANTDAVSPFAWYDMAVGMRAYRLAYLIDAGMQAGLLAVDEEQALWRALELHQAFLSDDANIVFHNNHGFYQAAGQLAMGRRFSGRSAAMATALEQGEKRLREMITQQFSPDGIHREHSPDYHRMVYDSLKSIIDSDLIEDPSIIAFAKRIEQALTWFVTPSLRMVNFGDSDSRDVSRSVHASKVKWRTEEMRYIVTGGKIGKKPSGTVQAFRDGGYFVVRKPSAEHPEDITTSSYLAQAAAFHSRTHKHADDLTFVWAEGSSDIIVDSGRYGYLGKAEQGSELWLDGYWYTDPNRVYCESTRAHNTLEFDELNYQRRGAKPYGSALRRWGEDANGIIAVETECTHFRSIQRSRLLVFDPGHWLVVFDWFHDNMDKPHQVRQWFHLAPGVNVRSGRDGYLASLPGRAVPLQIGSLLEGAAPSPLFLGATEPRMQGWHSAQAREIVPSPAFSFDQVGTTSGAFATLFSFSDQLETDPAWSKVNNSGRKGQLRWVDDRGRHTLRFERPNEVPNSSLRFSVTVD